jgi:hypothetical protein
VLLDIWQEFLREVYELMGELNQGLLQGKEYEEIRCPDMQRFLSFIYFAFDWLRRVRRITNRDLSTPADLKSRFDKLRIRKERILKFIVSPGNRIGRDEPIRFYDLYLLIIDTNTTPEEKKDLGYIYLHLHELKAYRIAREHMYDSQCHKLVEAIRSLSLVARRYQNLSEKKRNLIRIMEIEEKMAKLLGIVEQYEIAGQIYFKNRLH